MPALRTISFLILASCLALPAPAAEPTAAEPDPVALLKESRELLEKIPPDFQGRAVLPLGVAECLFGDREQGRKHFATAIATAKTETEMTTRFGVYGAILQAQHSVGLTNDVYDTIRTAWEDEKAVPEREFFGPILVVYGVHVIDFYASLDDAPSALRFIDAARIVARPDEIENERRRHRAMARLGLVDSLLKYGKREKADELLKQTVAEYSKELERSGHLAELQIRLKHPEDALATVDSVLKKMQDDGPAFYAREAIVKVALVYAEQGTKDEALKLLAKLPDAGDGKARWDEFKIYAKLGDYDKAIETANRPEKAVDPDAAPVPGQADERDRARNLSAFAVLLAKGGRRELSDKYFAEVEALYAAGVKDNRRFGAEESAMDIGFAHFTAGDPWGLITAAGKIENPMMKYIANLVTAVELHNRKTGKKSGALWPKPEFE